MGVYYLSYLVDTNVMHSNPTRFSITNFPIREIIRHEGDISIILSANIFLARVVYLLGISHYNSTRVYYTCLSENQIAPKIIQSSR